MQLYHVYIDKAVGDVVHAQPRPPHDFATYLAVQPRLGECIKTKNGVWRIRDLVHIEGDMGVSPLLFV